MAKIYKSVINNLDKIVPSKYQAVWNHPAGPKTIFFWAPAFKWSLVIAGLGDIARPTDQLSLSQSTALAFTGIIWSRYSLAITPKNYNLLSVNIFVASTAIYQIFRIFHKCDKLVPLKWQPVWQHPAGPKTIFFWAPTFKWLLVIAGLSDITRPADKLSLSQSASLGITGTICVNFFVGVVGCVQVCRIMIHNRSTKKEIEAET